jgi:hypothetical protein
LRKKLGRVDAVVGTYTLHIHIIHIILFLTITLSCFIAF